MNKIIFFAAVIIILTSCGSNGDRSITENVAAFVENNNNISNFGFVDVKALLDKAEYKSIDKFGSEIAKEVTVIQKLISTDKPIYFAMEGATEMSGDMPTVYVFAEVKNRDSLVANVQKRGYDMDKNGEYDYHESGDVAFAITDNTAVFVTRKGLTEGKKIIEAAIDGLKSDLPKNKVSEILGSKGDIVIGIDVESAYLNLEKTLNMDNVIKKELSTMAKESYSKTIITFETGAINLKTENYFSEELKKYLAFGENSMNVISKLGSGKPQAAFAMNVDMKKIQSFLNKYSPNLLNQAAEKAGGQAQFALAFLGEDGLAGLFSGKLGVALMGQPDVTGGFKPEFNFYVGLGKTSLPLIKGFVENGSQTMAKLELKGTDLVGVTLSQNLPGKGGLKLPKGCENFGEKPISGFVNFDGLDMTNFDFEYADRYVKLFDYLTFEMDVNGATVHLEVKNKKKNILKVLVDEASEDIKDQMMNL